MKRSWLLLVLMFFPCQAEAFGFSAEGSLAPLGEYLDRPFGHTSVCAYDANGSTLSAADMHFLGAPKQVIQRQISYHDDGSVQMDSRTVTHIMPNGNLLDSVSSTDDKGIFSKIVWKYGASQRLSEIDEDLPVGNEHCVAKFFYDGRGLLSQIATSRGGGDRTIIISRFGDGRPREAIERRSTGQADWRLTYAYSGRATTIDRYAHDDDGDSHDTSTFEFDDAKRIAHIAAQTEVFGSQHSADFRFRYLPGGIVIVHTEATEQGKPCIQDYSLHRNGDTDLQSMHIWGEKSLLCHGPGGADDHYRSYFDHKGNVVVDREEHDVVELGRVVTRPEIVTMNAITYY